MRAAPLLVASTPLWAAPLVACSLALGVGEDQCETDRDCAERGAPSDLRACDRGVCRAPVAIGGDFACLERVREEAVGAPVEARQRLLIHDLNSVALPGVPVQLCAVGDIECTRPIDEGETDSGGRVEFGVETDYKIYFQYAAPGAMPGLLHTTPSYRLVDGALVVAPLAAGATDYDAFALSLDVVGRLAAAAGATLAPGLGSALVRVLGCAPGVPGAGVSVEVEGGAAETRVFYDRGGTPVAADATDASGLAYALNLPPGLVRVRAKVRETGRPLGERTVVTRAGTLTAFALGPSP